MDSFTPRIGAVNRVSPRAGRRSNSPKKKSEGRALAIWRVRWEREHGQPNRSRRFSNHYQASRFVRRLWDEDAQLEWGTISWTRIEKACGTIGPWRRVRDEGLE